MSRLRDQFQAARGVYSSVSYPGNLPMEVLPPPPPVRWYKWPARLGFGGLAAAAAVAWVVLLSRPAHKPPTRQPRPEPHDQVAVVRETPGLSLSPPAVPEMPEMPDFSGMPALPVMPAGFTGANVPEKVPSLVPDIIPMEPPGLPPTAPAVSHDASIKEPA